MNNYEIQHLQMIHSGLAECTVLLKKDGRFPISAPGKIAAYGSGVRKTVKGGTGSGEVNSRFFVTVEQGLKDAGFTLTTASWLDAYDQIYVEARKAFVNDIKKKARELHTQAVFLGMGAVMPEPNYHLPLDAEGDTAIYVLSRTSGEGNDRVAIPGDYLLSETEKRDILALNEKYDNFMLVLNVGGPVDLSPVQEVKNILVLSQLGVETGAVLADILLGKAYPSGKLTATWAKAENYPDVGNFGDINDSFYKEGIYVGYRWFDAAKRELLYPFGFGLGYAEFAVSEETVSVSGDTVTVSALVQNVGDLPGKETVQVYLSCPQGKLDKPVKELAGFAKTMELAPGAKEPLTVSFHMADFASYDQESASYILEHGHYIVRCGTSSSDTKAVAALALGETVTVRQVENLLCDPGFADWKPQITEEPIDIPVIALDAASFTTESVDYQEEEALAPEVSGMTGEELCLMNIGAFNPKGGILSVIGNASMTVAGAAGESTGLFRERGIPSMVMADGPAGLRISAQYYEDKKGVHSYGAAIPETVLEFMPKLLQMITGNTAKLPKGATLKDQYCTAIPIGTAVALSWNVDFAQACGDMIGSELERFGVHLWLAPALNIHRTAMCGRNFEYYSEDPVISGMFAAALTKGIQSHPGRGVTIKHYCANNQETNRYFTNSVVSERAMREIYLKGFQLCIREASPKAVMTSYNLLNGVHTSESRALCTGILRREFGFEGVCMTDWLATGLAPAKGSIYTVPDPAKIAAAGGDLYMPGSKFDYKKMLKGLHEGRVSETQLKINATRVYRLAKHLTGK